ncbi:glycine cleavage system protein H [Candidatus Acidianus copahuensis]|uniref:Probable glycine cleavage system H protein n=2 Tax=Sulfolobaceae TaxID=118883 RepID=A0A031LP81_9CREN|nr:glycine cleavage system protein H [Candidatus Acidianus copahuensis]
MNLMSSEVKVGKYIVLVDRFYTDTDEWVKIDGNIAIIGITDYAQKKLRDIVGIDLPKVGQKVKLGDVVATVESVKAASDIFSPLSGTIIEVNYTLTEEPEKINKSPYDEGWIFKIQLDDDKEKEKLLTYDKYVDRIKGD